MSISIKDRFGNEVLRFSNFLIRSSLPEPKQVFITFDLELNTGSVSGNFKLDAELSDFEEMLDHLEVLNEDLRRTFYFQHSDERIEIKFTPNNLGIIVVEGFVFEKDYASKVDFRFETDQSHLVDIIDQSKGIISHLTVASL